jgi:hypothetical protein
MSFQPQGSFTVDCAESRLKDVFAPTGGWNDKLPVKAPWQIETPVQAREPAWKSDEDFKRRFGIELAKAEKPFDAACLLCGEDTSKALWISFHWLSDPIVVASKDAYVRTLALSTAPLDKDQLAAKVLALADEKVLNPRTGMQVPLNEAKDRIAAFKLYSEIMGYTGKVEVDASTKTFINNELKIKFVRPDPPKATVINQAAPKNNLNLKSEITNEGPSPITLKLVGGVSR